MYDTEHEAKQNLLKTEKSSHNGSGTGFGNRGVVQVKITHKDLILIAGILVALIIALTTWMLDNPHSTESKSLVPAPKVIPSAVHKIGQTILPKR